MRGSEVRQFLLPLDQVTLWFVNADGTIGVRSTFGELYTVTDDGFDLADVDAVERVEQARALIESNYLFDRDLADRTLFEGEVLEALHVESA